MRRVLVEALRHLRAQPVMALVAVLGLAHALFFVGAAAWVGVQIGATTDALADGLYLTASLDPALDEAQVKAVAEKLAKPDEVEVVRVRTPKEERERLATALGEDLLDGLDDLALPGSVTIDLRLTPGRLDAAAVERLDQLVKGLSEVRGVISLPWDPGHVHTLFSVASMVHWLGFGLAGLALVIAVALAAELVRRRLVGDREAAAIARAFGATERWIELPHYVAAGAVGALAAVAAVVGAGLVEGRLVAVARLVPGLADASPMIGPTYLGWCLVGGVGLALAGAWLSVRRAAAAP